MAYSFSLMATAERVPLEDKTIGCWPTRRLVIQLSFAQASKPLG
jgi:hypothetical protein